MREPHTQSGALSKIGNPPTHQSQPEHDGTRTGTPDSRPRLAGPRVGKAAQPPQTQGCSGWPAFPELVSHHPGAVQLHETVQRGDRARISAPSPQQSTGSHAACRVQVGYSPANPAPTPSRSTEHWQALTEDTWHWALWGTADARMSSANPMTLAVLLERPVKKR